MEIERARKLILSRKVKRFYSTDIRRIFNLPELCAIDDVIYWRHEYDFCYIEVKDPVLIRYFLHQQSNFLISLDGIEEYIDDFPVENNEYLRNNIMAIKKLTFRKINVLLIIEDFFPKLLDVLNCKSEELDINKYLGIMGHDVDGNRYTLDLYKDRINEVNFRINHDSPLADYAKQLGYQIAKYQDDLYKNNNGWIIIKNDLPLEQKIKLYKRFYNK